MSPAPLTGYVNTVELKLFSFFLSFLASATVKADKAKRVCFWCVGREAKHLKANPYRHGEALQTHQRMASKLRFKVTTVKQPDLPDFFFLYLKASVWVIEVVMARSNGAICLKWSLKILDCGLHFLFSVNGDQLQNKDRLLSTSSLAPYKCSNKNGWLNSQMRCCWRAICSYWWQPRNKNTCIITIYCLHCQLLLKMGFSGTSR